VSYIQLKKNKKLKKKIKNPPACQMGVVEPLPMLLGWFRPLPFCYLGWSNHPKSHEIVWPPQTGHKPPTLAKMGYIGQNLAQMDGSSTLSFLFFILVFFNISLIFKLF
jgi:hypothetical protein